MNSVAPCRQQNLTSSGGFALVVALSLMAFVLLLIISITTLVQVESQSARIETAKLEAKQAALLGLQVAIGELQKFAGPDQRITATAEILSNDNSKTPSQGRNRWVGVWDSSSYSPASPDAKTFNRWLVSSNESSGFSSETHANDGTLRQSLNIFQAVDASGNRVLANDVVVDKIPIEQVASSTESYYAYWVEDNGVKADLSWNEGEFSQVERKQVARLSSTPGVDYAVFAGDATSPFKGQVAHPLEKDSGNNDWLANMDKVVSNSGVPLAVGGNSQSDDWLNSVRHDVTFGSRAVLCDVKNGGLRRDLSLAFEMDADMESENAISFNQQVGEFVAGGDSLAAPQQARGMPLEDRYLFRDFRGAGNDFSSHISVPETVVRGPSWWLLRDYANLYKRLSSVGGGYSLDARAYFPNRTAVDEQYNLMDIHADDQWGDSSIQVHALNRESNSSGGYAFRPARASYAPVLLGVNAIYSLVYESGQLKLVVDPFFILWNPYDTQVTAEKFALTLRRGLPGGVVFRVTDLATGVQTQHGRTSGGGAATNFADYAKHKSGVTSDLSYLISDLRMGPGEVLIYSPPNEANRGGDANVLNDELVKGLNYKADASSGIYFQELPDVNGSNWSPTFYPVTPDGYTLEVMFNAHSSSGNNVVNLIETNMPDAGTKPDELTDKANFGAHIAGKEFRLRYGGSVDSTNVFAGERGWSVSYKFGGNVGGDLGTLKQSFGILSMLTLPTDHAEADTSLEIFSQFNATPAVCTLTERFDRAPLNMVVKSFAADGINSLMNEVGVSLADFGSGDNGFYGKSYDGFEGDSFFPLLSIPKAPLYSLVQFSEANLGTRLFEPTHAVGNSWRPPYIPKDSVYDNNAAYYRNVETLTLSDTSWLVNDALFDRYYLSGIAADYTIGSSYQPIGVVADTLGEFYGGAPRLAKVNPALEAHIPDGRSASGIVSELAAADGYKKLGAYSLLRGAFNVNSTSIDAWAALLRSNKDLAIQTIQGTTDAAAGTPFPLAATASDTSSLNGWEAFSRLSDQDIDLLAAKIVDEVKTRGPFMSLSDFVNRRISDDSSSAQGALQDAIEQAKINDPTRSVASDTTPNYNDFSDLFPYANGSYIGSRTNATGIPLEVNQANILLPLAPKLTSRSDTFTIRAYGEVTSVDGDTVKAVCEATLQRFPEYMDTTDNPWDENFQNPLYPSGASQLQKENERFGRRFKVVQLRWLEQDNI